MSGAMEDILEPITTEDTDSGEAMCRVCSEMQSMFRKSESRQLIADERNR